MQREHTVPFVAWQGTSVNRGKPAADELSD